MKTKAITLLIAGLGLCSASFAQQTDTTTTTRTQTATTKSQAAAKGDRASYRAAKKQADATYKSAKTQCDAMSGIQKENCIGIAKAQQKYDKAAAQAHYKDTTKNRRDAQMAAAQLQYAKDKAQCESRPSQTNVTGTPADVCMTQANEKRNQAIANAKAGKEMADDGKAGAKSTTTKPANGTITPGSSMDTRGDIGKK